MWLTHAYVFISICFISKIGSILLYHSFCNHCHTKIQRFDWLRGVQLIINFCVTKGKYTLRNSWITKCEKNRGNLICVSWSVIYTFLCKQKQKQTFPSKRKNYLYCGRIDILKVEMNGIYSASDYDINTLKQGRSSKDTKKLTLSWMRVFNNRK